jgi:hypothetical protein
MKPRIDPDRAEKLYGEALEIQEGRRRGWWVPRMQYLAFRGYDYAMTELARWYSDSNDLADLGSARDPFSAAGLYRRAYRQGSTQAAQHMAMGCFNRGDMAGYRHWLAQGAKAGDEEAREQRRNFETRLWHSNARKVGRLRPTQKRDGFE